MTHKSVVLIVCDVLRHDLIAPDLTPAICGFAEAAYRFSGCRSVFTSTTRVVSASMATGCTPGHHGLAGNVVALKEPDGLAVRSVGDPDFRDRLRLLTGRTLKQPTPAERISPVGESIVFSNVSPGAAYFQDPEGFDCYKSPNSPEMCGMDIPEQKDIPQERRSWQTD